jgi:pimeloyl-ACP methyl ester carboxylesterase
VSLRREGVYIERYGQGEKILFIHGSGWNTHMWHGQSDYLASSMEVILVDLPGHGKSPGNGCDSVEEYRETVHELMKERNIERSYIAGHSLGGAIALSLSLAYPDIISGAILIGTGARLRVLPQILEGVVNDKEKTVADTVEMAFSPKTPPTLKGLAIAETMKCPAEIIYKDFQGCNAFDVMESISSLEIPVLIICGSDDVLTLPKYSFYLNEAIQGSKLILVQDAGHMVMMEKPMEVNRAIERFVKRNNDIPM